MLARLRQDRGSAVAEFVLVSALLILLTAVLIQLAAYLHVRNLAADAASNGARVGAMADATVQDGIDRARDLAALAGGGDGEVAVTGSESEGRGGSTVTVTVTVRVPVLGVIPGPLKISAEARATRFL